MIIEATFLLLLFVYCLLSNRIEKTHLTAPIIFTVTGIFIGALALSPGSADADTEILLNIAELGLVLLLFTDGSHIHHVFKGGFRSIPGRLLSIGMVFTIGMGLVIAMLIFGHLSIWEAGILAAILAPTDAGLGQAIVTSPKVPQHFREALNVEAGLNDGLSVPFLLFFTAMLMGGGGPGFHEYFIAQFGYGVVIGLCVGAGGSRLYDYAQSKGWIGHEYTQLGFAVLPAACVLISEMIGASMFIAAFVAGLAVKRGGDESLAEQRIEFTEDWGQLINLTVFFIFGLIVSQYWSELAPEHFLYAALSLTVIRMIPVALAVTGLHLKPGTVLFLGWFGPRGLASIVLGLVYLEQVEGYHEPTIQLCVITTVLASIILHGLTAKPGAALYHSYVERQPDGSYEADVRSIEN